MIALNQQKAARDFAKRWQGRGYEKGESQIFWTELLTEVFGVEHPSEFLHFEQQVHIDHTSFIDAYVPRTHTMIEQKSIEKDLGVPIRQSDGTHLNPFQQAKRYAAELPYSQRPRWIVTCNFREFWVYDMEQPNGEPQKIALANLGEEYYRLQFLVDQGNEHLKREMEVSVKAGELVGIIYDKLLEQYWSAGGSPADDMHASRVRSDILRSLNILCVRLVFCLYAEDAGLFPTRTYFHDYLASFPTKRIRKALIDLFEVLDTPLAERDPYLDEDLAAFPYVNGGLFGGRYSHEKNTRDADGSSAKTTAGEPPASPAIIIPQFTDDLKNLLLEKASADFDWSEISPTIFGAVFESTLNPETRRSGGMHYTSIENIHKVIDPLFLNELRAEFEEILGTRSSSPAKAQATASSKMLGARSSTPAKTPATASTKMRTGTSALQKQALLAFQDKLASLTFFDPACGSGNFLTETFLSLRRLENEVIKAIYGDTRQLGFEGTIKVNISQFYGIEINDFACTVAKTALWIAESQTLKETSSIVGVNLNFLPLKTNAYIHEGNALRTDWAGLFVGAQAARLQDNNAREPNALQHYPDYIIGNPPFVGYSLQTKEQKEDILNIYKDEKGKPYKTAGKIDYVAGWYWKAAELMLGARSSSPAKKIKAALVSTNSITQGEQVAAIWEPLYERFGINIDFAYRTFRWDSEAEQKAHVHCVIVGFSLGARSSSPAPTIGKERLKEIKNHTRGYLPHFEQQQFQVITFRLYDSIPRQVIDQWKEQLGIEDRRAGEDDRAPRIFLSDNQVIQAQNINPYLIDAPVTWINSRNKPICDVPQMIYGSKPTDGGFLFLSEQEYNEIVKKEPQLQKWIKRIYGSEEFINNKKRYCFWLVGISPQELRNSNILMDRINKVRDYRLASPKAATRESANTSWLFQEVRYSDTDYIIIPRVSSERRRYVPIGFMTPDAVVNDAVQFVPNATLYHFGILTSNVHMAWMRVVCGRLKSDYRYSKDIVYNNFPWPLGARSSSPAHHIKDADGDVRAPIEQTAQAILDARALYPYASLADLYDEVTMPPELRRAHQENDKAVMAAYGFTTKMTESECVAELFKMYQKLTK